MFGNKKRLEVRISALESDMETVRGRYWDLSNKYALLLDYLELKEVQPNKRPYLMKMPKD